MTNENDNMHLNYIGYIALNEVKEQMINTLIQEVLNK